MIIGISGKKQSGKDTIAKIIQGFDIYNKQYSVLKDEYPISNLFVKEFVLGKIGITNATSWVVKKFAGKLKEIVSVLTGFTVDELENEDIKNTKIFTSYELRNKSIESIETFATMEELVDRLEYLRNIYLKTYSAEEVNGIFEQEIVNITPRLLLQRIGTEVGREISPNIWIDSLFKEYDNIINHIKSKLRRKGFSISPNFENYPNWIITDVRFPNEAKAIKNRDGLLIRVNRQTQEELDREQIITFPHESEIALDNYEHFDYIIDNNNCIECLIEKVKEILKIEKII